MPSDAKGLAALHAVQYRIVVLLQIALVYPSHSEDVAHLGTESRMG